MAYCRKCGKEFFPTPEHVYRSGSKLYCCWTCFNHRNDNKKRRPAKQVEWRTMDGYLLNTFQSAADAAASIEGNFQAKTIRTACRLGTPYKGYRWNYK